MQEHFGVAHVLGSRLLSEHDVSANDAVKKFDRSNLLRLSGKYFPDQEKTALEILKKVCRYTHRSEKFFLININARNQWLRTVIGHADLGPDIWTEAEGSGFDFDNIIIHSNILPYDPCWTCREWRATGIECGLGKHDGSEDGSCERSLRILQKGKEAAHREMATKRRLAKGDAGGIWLLTLEGGRFIGKTGDKRIIEAELKVLKIIHSHPHIVYGFEHPCEEARELCEETRESGEETCESGDSETCGSGEETPISAYFMEYMAHDLKSFIAERIRTVTDKPPFETLDSVDILLQIAKAMEHMHDMTVVHCDLKSENILIREIVTSDNVKHYLVKVADFGSARSLPKGLDKALLVPTGLDSVRSVPTGLGSARSVSTGHFVAGNGTTPYSAPEALAQRKDKKVLISIPPGIDVYSFGIVAFEVLTGIFKHLKDSAAHPSKFKESVRKGVRPLFPDFVQDKELISLVEDCWSNNPSERPSFVAIRKKLELRVRISEHREKAMELGEELLQTNRIGVNEESVPCATPETCKGGLDTIRVCLLPLGVVLPILILLPFFGIVCNKINS